MIAYDDLVVALTNWRANQGLPTGAAAFLSEDDGSVDLALPVADPISVAAEAVDGDALISEEIDADNYEAVAEHAIADDAMYTEEAIDEEQATVSAADDDAMYAEEVVENEPDATEGFSESEVAEDAIEAEGYDDVVATNEEYEDEPTAFSGEPAENLNYDDEEDETQYGVAPEMDPITDLANEIDDEVIAADNLEAQEEMVEPNTDLVDALPEEDAQVEALPEEDPATELDGGEQFADLEDEPDELADDR